MNKLKLTSPTKLPNISRDLTRLTYADPIKKTGPKQPLIPPAEFTSYLSAHRFKEQTGCKRKIKKEGMSKFVV